MWEKSVCVRMYVLVCLLVHIISYIHTLSLLYAHALIHTPHNNNSKSLNPNAESVAVAIAACGAAKNRLEKAIEVCAYACVSPSSFL